MLFSTSTLRRLFGFSAEPDSSRHLMSATISRRCEHGKVYLTIGIWQLGSGHAAADAQSRYGAIRRVMYGAS